MTAEDGKPPTDPGQNQPRQGSTSFQRALKCTGLVLLLVCLLWLAAFLFISWPGWRMSLSDLDLRGIYLSQGRSYDRRADVVAIQEKARWLILQKFPAGSSSREAIAQLGARGFQCRPSVVGGEVFSCRYSHFEFLMYPISILLLLPSDRIEWYVSMRATDDLISGIEVSMGEQWLWL